jgi:hypothetical protein
MRAVVVSTGDQFSLVRTDKGGTVHVPNGKVKRMEFRSGSKEPVPSGRHIRRLKKGELVEVFEVDGVLHEENGKIVYPTALAVGFADELELLKFAGPGGRAEKYKFRADVTDGNGQVIETDEIFEGPLSKLLEGFSADRTVKVSRPIKDRYPNYTVLLCYEVKLVGKEGFVSCPDPMFWHLPEPEVVKPAAVAPAKKSVATPAPRQGEAGYYVRRYSIDPATMETIEEELGVGMSAAEYNEKFRDELDELVVGALMIVVLVREPGGTVRHKYTRYNPGYEVRVKDNPATVNAAAVS